MNMSWRTDVGQIPSVYVRVEESKESREFVRFLSCSGVNVIATKDWPDEPSAILVVGPTRKQGWSNGMPRELPVIAVGETHTPEPSNIVDILDAQFSRERFTAAVERADRWRSGSSIDCGQSRANQDASSSVPLDDIRFLLLRMNAGTTVNESPQAGSQTEWQMTDQGNAGAGYAKPPSTHARSMLPEEGIDLKQFLAEVERNLIEQALQDSNEVVARAAVRLQIGRTTLVEKMRKYGIQRKRESRAGFY